MSITLRFSIAMLAAALTACGQARNPRTVNSQNASKGNSTAMIEYQAQATRNSYSFGEEIETRLFIRNQSAAALEFPDPEMATTVSPVFLLRGPGLGEGVWLTARKKLEGPPAPSVGQGAALGADPIEVAQGSFWSWVFPLNRVVKLTEPGHYKLRSRLTTPNGVVLNSEESTFELGEALISSAHLGLGPLPLGAGEARGAYLQNGGLFGFEFRESRPGIGEASLTKPIFRVSAGENASDVSVPWKNVPMFGEMVDWIVWREGRAVKALSTVSGAPVSIDAPMDLSRLVQPSLKTAGGPVESLALSSSGNEIALLHIAAAGAEPAALGWVWRAKLPAVAAEIAAAIGPAASGGARYVAMLSGAAGKYQVAYASFGASGGLSPFHSTPVMGVEGMSPVPGAFAVAEDSRGAVRFLSMFHSDKKEIALVDVVFENGKPRPVQPSARVFKGEWPRASVTRGALLPVVDLAGALDRSEALVLLSDGSLLRFDTESGTMQPAITPGAVTNPILLAPGQTGMYAIFHDAKRGLYPERQ